MLLWIVYLGRFIIQIFHKKFEEFINQDLKIRYLVYYNEVMVKDVTLSQNK